MIARARSASILAADGCAEESVSEFRFSPRPNRAGEISWRPWGPGAFEEAEKEGKLVLLSISAVWCHWCHVMDETTYSDPKIIEKINSGFIPVRVDSDRRPDVNGRYNQGGWPTTAFLIPSGRAVAGFTYMPAANMAEILDELVTTYRHRRDLIETEAVSMAAREAEILKGICRSEADVDSRAGEEVAEIIIKSWDKGYGGIGSEPKFPPFDAIEFALARYLETGDKQMRSFAVTTLDGMKNGEINDHVEGGFFRYATARDWSAPHYEKMLADNAELISAYLAASSTLDRDDLAETARLAIEYVIENLIDDEQRGFFGSQDADEKYYHRDLDGRSVLEKPGVDRTIYTDSTARMISALVRASAVLNDPNLLAIAERSSDFIWGHGFRHDRGSCHYFEMPDGSPRLWGQPADQVYLLRAIVDLYQATGDPRHRERARELGDLIINHHITGNGWLGEKAVNRDEENGATPGILEDFPASMPDIAVNGHGARVLLTLDILSPERGYREAAGRILKALAGTFKDYSYFASSYALAVEAYLEGHFEVRINPHDNSSTVQEIARLALGFFNPRLVIRAETVEDYFEVEGEETGAAPPAVVCSPGTCRPVYSASDVKMELETLTSAAVGGDSDGSDVS